MRTMPMKHVMLQAGVSLLACTLLAAQDIMARSTGLAAAVSGTASLAPTFTWGTAVIT